MPARAAQEPGQPMKQACPGKKILSQSQAIFEQIERSASAGCHERYDWHCVSFYKEQAVGTNCEEICK